MWIDAGRRLLGQVDLRNLCAPMAIGDAFLRRQIMCASDRSMHQSGIILEVIRKADRSTRTRRGFEVADVDCGATYQMVLRLFNGAPFNTGSELTRYGIGPGDRRSDGPVPRRLVCAHSGKKTMPARQCRRRSARSSAWTGSLARAPGGWSRNRGGAAATIAQDVTARARPSERQAIGAIRPAKRATVDAGGLFPYRRAPPC